MTTLLKTALKDRGIISVTGADSRDFLQGLISNNIESVSPERTIYSAFLTPQGKYLFDFFICQIGDELLIDCERARLADFIKRLRMYKLRAQVELTDRSDDFKVVAFWGENAIEASGLEHATGATKQMPGGTLYVDPRLKQVGLRAIVSDNNIPINASDVEFFAYDTHRLSLGLPDSSRDLIVDKSVLLESGLDDLNAIDWEKGCYMGQEVTARSKYRGLVKKRLIPVRINGTAPHPGSSIMSDDKTAGEMRSSAGDIGLALMRIDYLGANMVLTSADAPSTILTPEKPDWATF